MSQQNKHITEDLVVQVAIVAYEQVRILSGDIPVPGWTAAGPFARYTMKNQVHENLNMIIPILIAQGWTPPETRQAPEEQGHDGA